jgi:hypothetical protein
MMGGKRNDKKKSLKGRIEIHVVFWHLLRIEEDDQKEGVKNKLIL